MALIKPQFEAGREKVGKHGIVRDEKVHLEVVQELIAFAVKAGYDVLGLDFSPITGGEGNIEFLVHLRSTSETATISANVDPSAVIKQAHQTLLHQKDK